MAKAGYHGVSLEEAASFLLNGAKLPRKSVLITFDDGYLDNYIYAKPILSQYGHHATVFAVADRLEPKGLRPTSKENTAERDGILESIDSPYFTDEVGNAVRKDRFMSWDEARVAEASGVLDVAAHSLSHAPVWGAPPVEKWQDKPEEMEIYQPAPRHRTFDRPEQAMPYGLPILPELAGLPNRGFILSNELISLVESLVPQELQKATDFFLDKEKTQALKKAVLDLPAEQWGQMETEDAYRRRVRHDLTQCRVILERELAYAMCRPLTRCSLAWPWGKYSPEALEIARDIGFQVFFCTSFGANLPGKNPRHVHRFKARDKSASWLLSRLKIYSNPTMARFYAAMRI